MSNKHGWGPFSTGIAIIAASVPQQVSAPTFSIVSDTNVRIAWLVPNNGGNPISAYSIVIQQSDGTTYSSMNSYCSGSSPTVISNRYCDIPMTALRASPFNLVKNQLVVAQVAAINGIGTGSYSTPNTAGLSIRTEPSAPPSAPLATSYGESSATLLLTTLSGTATGGATILYYDLAWDAGTNGVTWNSYTVSSSNVMTVMGLTSGWSYQFRYRTMNVFGWGLYSPVLTLTAMALPQQTSVVTTANVGAAVQISWAQPYSGGSNVPITAYSILIKKADGSFIAYLPSCDGTLASVIAS